MPVLQDGPLELLTEDEVERILLVTDGFRIKRDCVIVPLACAAEGKVWVMPDGNLLIRGPGHEQLESWVADLPFLLRETNLSRTPRRSGEDSKRHLTGPHGPRSCGTRSYMDHQPDLNVVRYRILPTPGLPEAKS